MSRNAFDLSHGPPRCPKAHVLIAVLMIAGACAGPGESSGAAPPSDAGGPFDGVPAPDASIDTPGPGGRDGQDDSATSVSKAAEGEVSVRELLRQAAVMLDDWHAAAAVGDRDRYLEHFAPDGVFLGTDATERWDYATFSAYVKRNFEAGHGWTYVPRDRHLALSDGRDLLWFDEALDSGSYGELRGTGIMRRAGDDWKLVQYSMTFTIPNGVQRQVVDVVRAGSR